jgi:hypothetical protein
MPSWLQGVNAELIRDVILMSYDHAERMPTLACSAASHLDFVWNPTFGI